MTTTALDPAPSNPSGWRYRHDGSRDLRLDLIRGYALAAMSINHFGLQQSWFHQASGRSSALVSAAEAFLFISGFTLGWISLGRAPGAAMERLWKRTWVLYLATVGVSLGFVVVSLQTDWLLWAGYGAEAHTGPIDLLGDLLTLKPRLTPTVAR
ncbi:MAG: OpgC domain-containing protein [Actinomycetota bacterium]